MVVIVLKKSDKDQFLFETTISTSNDEMIRQLVRIWNMRLKTELLSGAVEELAKFGPTKPESERGIDEIQDRAQQSDRGSVPDRGPNYAADPTGNRTGEAPGEQLQKVLLKVAQDAKLSISDSQLRKSVPLTEALLEEKLSIIKGAVIMAYPMGLPASDPIRIALADENHSKDIYGEQQLDPATAQLWWAGKEFLRGQTVGDRVGKNEKTKVVAKLQMPGSGAPAREAAVTEDERKAMMAHYFKKQEEMKKLAENNADDYLNSSWADTSQLRRSLNGTSDIKFR